MLRRVGVLATVLCLCGVSACGEAATSSDDENADAKSAPHDDRQILQAWATLGEALTTGDGQTACSLGTDAFKDQLLAEFGGLTGVTSSCEAAVGALANKLSDDQEDLDFQKLARSQKVIYEGETASVYGPDVTDFRPFAYVDGQWIPSTEGPLPPGFGDAANGV